MPTILDYYEFAKLATAAYVVMDRYTSFSGADFALESNRDDAMRLPIALANQMFDSNSDEARRSGQPIWTIPAWGYRGNDPTTGFAATLSANGGTKEKGLAPGPNPYLDLLKGDPHGEHGMAVVQTVSLLNCIRQLRAPLAAYCQVAGKGAMSSSNYAVGGLCHVA